MKMNIFFFVVFFIVVVLFINYNIVYNFIDMLLNGYNKMVWGSKDMIGKIIVCFIFQIVNIVEFDE